MSCDDEIDALASDVELIIKKNERVLARVEIEPTTEQYQEARRFFGRGIGQ